MYIFDFYLNFYVTSLTSYILNLKQSYMSYVFMPYILNVCLI